LRDEYIRLWTILSPVRVNTSDLGQIPIALSKFLPHAVAAANRHENVQQALIPIVDTTGRLSIAGSSQ
jgi:hypothetical protein